MQAVADRRPSERSYQKVAQAIRDPRHRLAAEQVRSFWTDGHLGPLGCDDPDVAQLPTLVSRSGLINRSDRRPIPDPSAWGTSQARHINVHDPHLRVPQIRKICAHPSIVNPVAQILGSRTVHCLQTRFRAKFPEKADPVPWHQDIGDNNGGCYEDGSPIPTITVWLSVDGATDASGSLQVLPGTHRELFGQWQLGFHSGLEDAGALGDVDMSTAKPLEAGPNQFHLIHSWTLHRSTGNSSTSPRTALVMRFVAPEGAIHPEFEYIEALAG